MSYTGNIHIILSNTRNILFSIKCKLGYNLTFRMTTVSFSILLPSILIASNQMFPYFPQSRNKQMLYCHFTIYPHIELFIVVASLDFRYGDKEWTNTKHCQGIKSLQCDLSQETSDPREWYYARVRSLSAESYSPWVLSPRFHPHWDSKYKNHLNIYWTSENILHCYLR